MSKDINSHLKIENSKFDPIMIVLWESFQQSKTYTFSFVGKFLPMKKKNNFFKFGKSFWLSIQFKVSG